MYGRIVVHCTIEVLLCSLMLLEVKFQFMQMSLHCLSSRFSAIVFLTISYGSGGFKIQDNSNVSACVQTTSSAYIGKTGVSRASFDSSRLPSSSSFFISSALFKIQLTNCIEYSEISLPRTPLSRYFSNHLLSAFLKLWHLEL